MDVNIESSWKKVLSSQFEQAYFKGIVQFIKQERLAGKVIYPLGKHFFTAFNETPFEQVKVLILGQDPYHGPNQAHGLCFSVQEGIAVPPSLQNIYKEIASDIGSPIPASGNLLRWAQQGVLLLNASLTVEAAKPMSHAKIGWEQFTDAVIHEVSAQKEGVVFLLWGSFAQSKIPLIDARKHLILTAPHPSPLSSHRGFFGCKHFSKTNEYLLSKGKQPIIW